MRSTSDPAITGASWAPGVRVRIYDHVFGALDREVGGFLLGRQEADGRLHVTEAVAAESADMSLTSITFTQSDWSTVHAEIDARGTGEDIVGWYHSHPGFGIFLSPADLFIHRNFFSASGQIAYVVDPRKGREGVFGWRDGDVQLLGERPTDRPPAGLAPPVPPPAARPAPRRSLPLARAQWAPVHYLPAIAIGVVLGLLAAWVLLGTTKAPAPASGPPPPATHGTHVSSKTGDSARDSGAEGR